MSRSFKTPSSLPTALQTSRIGTRLFVGSLLLAVASAMAWPALADGPGGRHGGPGHASMGGPGPGGPFGGSPRHMERLLDEVGATDAQKAQIKQIVDASRAEMTKQHEAGRALRTKMRQVLTAPTIDTNAAEQLRLQMIAQHEQASRRGLQTMVDMAQVLTPEQRAKVGERMARREVRMQERMHERMNGRGGPRDGAPPKSE